MLPFDADSKKEVARQTIYDPVPFDAPLWKYASSDSKDLIKKLLIKDPAKIIEIDEVLKHPWIIKRSKKIAEMRQEPTDLQRFELYSTTTGEFSPKKIE